MYADLGSAAAAPRLTVTGRRSSSPVLRIASHRPGIREYRSSLTCAFQSCSGGDTVWLTRAGTVSIILRVLPRQRPEQDLSLLARGARCCFRTGGNATWASSLWGAKWGANM